MSGPVGPRPIGSCYTKDGKQKARWQTRQAARSAAKRINKANRARGEPSHLRSYPCGEPGAEHYHIGNLPAWAVE